MIESYGEIFKWFQAPARETRISKCHRSFASSLGAIDLVLAAMKARRALGERWDLPWENHPVNKHLWKFSRKVQYHP